MNLDNARRTGLTELRGLDLRYAAFLVLDSVGVPLSLSELVDELASLGFGVGDRAGEGGPTAAAKASKILADALRWEVRRGRVRRVGRGLYAAGPIHRSSRYRARARLTAVRANGEG